MVGDYNIYIRNDEKDPDPLATDYLDLTGHYGFIPSHKLPTRGLRCLDHVMINSKKSTQILIYDSDITDHRTIILGIDRLAHTTNIPNNRTSSKINYQGIVCDLENFNPTNLYAHTDITNAVQDFTNIITELITKHTTTKLMKNREVLLKNTCINLIHDLKIKYEVNLLKAAHGDSKQTWKCIKSICNLNKKTNKNSLINESDNGSDAVNNVNRYFTSVGKDLADNILSSLSMTQKELVSLVSSPLTSTPVNSFFISPTDTYEITKIITSLKAASAPGWDKIKKNKYIPFSITKSTSPESSLQIQLHNGHSLLNNIKFNCPTLDKVDTIKYLGVLIDEHLSWTKTNCSSSF
ncbi:Uncharacterized protein OBRU01_02867 [Operophtera brumata]|uniref:Tick transposon n=1 Tax=Operophtera brumata TaxID=104452 RepID=A0A0L7LR96_OPEBR|nr:Uncharacterized protein OBRU01_02867 [Operophtera brumata]